MTMGTFFCNVGTKRNEIGKNFCNKFNCAHCKFPNLRIVSLREREHRDDLYVFVIGKQVLFTGEELI
jgi:hypothetical protein